MVLATGPGLAKVVEKLRIWEHFETPHTDLQIAEKACCIDYSDTWLSKRVHWLSKCQSTNRSATYYGYKHVVKFDTGVAWASLLITRIHPRVGHQSKIQKSLSTLYNTSWMHHHQVRNGCFEPIVLLDPVDVEEAYSNSTSHYHGLQWHDQLYGCRFASLAHRTTLSNEDLYFAVTFTGQNVSKYYAEVTQTTGMLLIPVHILNFFQKSESFWMWDKGINTNPRNETSYTAEYKQAFMQNVEHEYCEKHRQGSVNTLEKVSGSTPSHV